MPPPHTPQGGSSAISRPPRTSTDRTTHIAVIGLSLIALIVALRLAQDILVPVVFAITLALLLRPLVRVLHRLRLPMVLAAGCVVIGVLGITVGAGVLVYEPAKEWVLRAPDTFRQVEEKFREFRKPVEDVGRAAAEIEKIAAATIEKPKVAEVQIKGEAWQAIFLRHTGEALGSLVITIVLLFFLLATDGRFLQRLCQLALPRETGPSLVAETEGQISRYLVTVCAINVATGAAVTGAMTLLGMPNPILWGVLEAVLNFVPYFGAMIVAVITTVVAIVSFDDWRWIAVPLTYLAITNCEGLVVTPLVLGRRFEIDPVIVFLWLIFWGAVWGVGGALLAMPMLVLLKLLGERVDALAPLARFIDPAEPLPWRLHRRAARQPGAASSG